MAGGKPYMNIVAHYERCFQRYGDCHLGVDWLDADQARRRYQVMLQVIRPEDEETPISLLDFGCGTAALYTYIQEKKWDWIRYSGLDISKAFIQQCRLKYPEGDFYCLDILEEAPPFKSFDYVVMNGVFTEKGNLSFMTMFAYFQSMIRKIFPLCTKGLAFNVRSAHGVAQEEDLFHLPLSLLADFLVNEVSKSFIIRNDYGLEEYTVYVYRRQESFAA